MPLAFAIQIGQDFADACAGALTIGQFRSHTVNTLVDRIPKVLSVGRSQMYIDIG